MKMKHSRVVVTLAVDIALPEAGELDVEEIAASIERRVRVMRAFQPKRDALYIDGKINPKYFEIQRVYVVDPKPHLWNEEKT